MRINHNIAALNTYNQLSQNNKVQQQSLEKLSSGLRINSAADDAAGLAISEKMRGQIQGLEMASKNAQDGISLIQTAEGSLNESHSILQRMRELAVQSANDTNTEDDRAEIQEEVDKLAEELTRIGNNTEFNTQKLLDGGFEGTFHIGANETQNIEMSINDMRADALGVSASEGFDHEITIQDTAGSVTNANDVFYSQNDSLDLEVTQLEEETTVTSANNSVDANYAWKNDSGDYVAVSSNGEEYSMLESAVSDIGNATLAEDDSNNEITVNFGDSVTSGDVTLEVEDVDITSNDHSLTATATAQIQFEDTELDSGTYEVVTSNHAQVDGGTYNYGLLDSNDNMVALSSTDDGNSPQKWVSYEDTSQTVFTIKEGPNAGDNFLTGGDSITVTGDGGVDVSTQSAADSAISTIDNAIAEVSSERSKLGAYQNRLEHTINNLGTAAENLTAAESRIRDVDYAEAA